MNKYQDGIPFDPGYAPYYVDFYTHIGPLYAEIKKIKAIHQKKFKLSMFKSEIEKIINSSTAFYLGCMLWGAYIACRFKDTQIPLLDNHMLKLDTNSFDHAAIQENLTLKTELIKDIKRDYQYFLKTSLNIDNKILDILDTYKEFAILNSDFINTHNSSDVILPEKLNYFKDLNNEELDKLESLIMEIIGKGKLELLLETSFYH